MKVALVPDNIVFITLQVNGSHYHDFVPFAERISAYKDALSTLEKDVEELAAKGSGYPWEEYFWSYTHDNHRNDGVLGTIYHYYLINIFVYLQKQTSFMEIHCNVFVPRSFRRHLQTRLGLKVRYRTQDKLRHLLSINNSETVKAFFKVFRLLFNPNHFKTFASEPFKGRILVASNRNRLSNRYDHIRHLWDQNILVYPKKIDTPLVVKGYDTINFVRLLSFKEFFKAVVFSVNVLSSIRESTRRNSLLERYVRDQNFFQVIHLRLKQRLAEKAFGIIKPSKIYYSGSVSDPDQKLTVIAANKLGISTVVVACRPGLSDFRAEDRILRCEIKHSRKHLPTGFIVKDSFSRMTLQNRGYRSAIDIVTHEDHEQPVVKQYDNCLVVLFTQYHVNTRLLQLIAESNLSGFSNVLLRSHPNRRSIHALDQRQYSIINSISIPCQDITDLSWGEVRFTNSIAIGANTSSMLEAVSRGCGLVWLPFITDLSMQFFPLMQKLGTVSYSDDEFERTMATYNNAVHRTDLITKSVQSYKMNFR